MPKWLDTAKGGKSRPPLDVAIVGGVNGGADHHALGCLVGMNGVRAIVP